MIKIARLTDTMLLHYDSTAITHDSATIGVSRVYNDIDHSTTIIATSALPSDNNTVLYNDNGTVTALNENGRLQYDVDLVRTQPDPVTITTNRMRLYILSGYQWQDCTGFVLQLYVDTVDNHRLYLTNYVHNKGEHTNVQYAVQPLVISDKIYDRYIEFQINNITQLLQWQSDAVNKDYAGGVTLLDTNVIAIRYHNIIDSYYDNGYQRYRLNAITDNNISIDNTHAKLSAYIRNNPAESCFEYQARYGDEDIENYLYALNNTAGNQYYCVHNLAVVEQIDQSFVKVAEYTMVQKSNYDVLHKFRPVLYNKNVNSVSIDYTITIVNQIDGTAISTTSSATTTAVQLYGKNITTLPVQPSRPIIHNNIVQKSINITDSNIMRTRTVVQYINSATISIGGDNVLQLNRIVNNVSITVVGHTGLLPLDLEYSIAVEKANNQYHYCKIKSIDHATGHIVVVIPPEILLESGSWHLVGSTNNDKQILCSGRYITK